MNLIDVNDQLVNIAQICRGAPTATLRRAFVRALREMMQQSQWLTTNVPGTLNANQRQYTLGNDPYLDIVAIKGMQGSQVIGGKTQYWPIGPSDPEQWDPNAQPSLPCRYAYVPQSQFAVDPIPQQSYGVTVTLVVQPKEGAVMVPADPLVKWSNEVEAGALEYLLMVPGQPWSNPQIAVMRGKEFRAGIANAKADAQRKFNTGTQRVRPRPIMLA